ncbi:MAG: hypothetical protein HY751_03805 [Nitrospinae bacterium]|nr:hypothetical protein [Nitrospinota bacterium]
MSELNVAKSGYMLSNKPDYPREPSWPNFVWIVFLSMLLVTVVLWGISAIFDAPLEEVAAWAKTPNPAKAPWYFIGLQELLVYFDPWIAGVLLPTQIIIGLVLIPYVDISPAEQGKYSFSKRKFAVVYFSFGLFLWFLLIAIGQWFRGPSWEFYWPVIDYPIGGESWTYPNVPLKVSEAQTVNVPNAIGWPILFIFFGGGMVAPYIVARFHQASALCARLKDYLDRIGLVRYLLIQVHVLLTLSVAGKMILRLVFGYKYIVTTPFFNI